MTKNELAEWLHDNYEQLAKAENWQTQKITRVKFDDLPAGNKSTMLALADRTLKTFSIISLNSVAVVLSEDVEKLAHKNYPFGSESSIGSGDRSFYEKRKIAFIEGFKAGLNYR